MRVVIAPDAFSGTLSPAEAAAAVAAGWQRGAPADDLMLAPMSDGGESFIAVVSAVFRGVQDATVQDPLGRPVNAPWILADVAGRRIAVVESAQAAGGRTVALEDRNVRLASSYGVGELIISAVDSGAQRVVVGVGGTITNDGGAGLASALGARLLDENGEELPPGGAALADLDRIDVTGVDRRLRGVEVVAATDVDNVLCGPDGATRVFGPQKGGGPEDVELLEAALAHWGRIVARDVRGARGVTDRPGAGAGGGIGAALMAFAGAEVVSGVDFVAGVAGLAQRLAGADLVVTGEGRFDAQSLRGKVVAGVARHAGGAGVPCIVLAGSVAVDKREAAAAGVEQSYSLTEIAGSADAAQNDPAHWLAALAERVAVERHKTASRRRAPRRTP